VKGIGEFIVKMAELFEAEGRALRGSVFRLVVAVLLMVMVVLLVLGAVGLFGGSLYIAFAQVTGSAAAALAILGGIVLVVALIALLTALLVKGPGGRR